MARSSRSAARKTRQTNSIKVSDKKKATSPKVSKEKVVPSKNKTTEVVTPRITRNSKTHTANVKIAATPTQKRTREVVEVEPSRATRSKKPTSPPPKKMRTRSTVRQNTKATISNTTTTPTPTAASAKSQSQSVAKKNVKTEKKRVVFKAITPPKKLATKPSTKTTTKSKQSTSKSPVKKARAKTTKSKKPPAQKKKPAAQTPTTPKQPTRGRRSTQRSEASVKIPPISRARRSMHRSNEKSGEGEIPSDQPFQITEEEGKDSMEVAQDLKAEVAVKEEAEQQETTKNVENVNKNSTGKEKEESVVEDGKRKLEDEEEEEVPAKKAKVSSPSSKTDDEKKTSSPEKMEEESPVVEEEAKDTEEPLETEKTKDAEPEKESSKISEEANEKVDEKETNGEEEEEEKRGEDDDKTENATENAEKDEKVSEDVIPVTNDNNKDGAELNDEPKLISDHVTNDEAKKEDVEEKEKVAKVDCPTTNGVAYEANEFEMTSASNSSVIRRRFVSNGESEENAFSLVSYNCRLASGNGEGILKELEKLDAEVLCLQDVEKDCYTDVLQPHLKKHDYLSGIYHEGLVTFYKSNVFDLVEGKESDVGYTACDVYHMVMKDVENTSLDDGEKQALKTFLRQPAYALYVKLRSVKSQKNVCICNTNLPDVDSGMHTFQLAVLMRELTSQSEGSGNPHLICGTLNLKSGSPGLQVLKDGYLSEEMIEDLQSRKDVPIPDKDNAALIDLLWKCFQHTSSTLKSSYELVLGEENIKHFGSKDSVWHSSDSLRVVGVLDLINNNDDSEINHVSLKAKFNFINK